MVLQEALCKSWVEQIDSSCGSSCLYSVVVQWHMLDSLSLGIMGDRRATDTGRMRTSACERVCVCNKREASACERACSAVHWYVYSTMSSLLHDSAKQCKTILQFHVTVLCNVPQQYITTVHSTVNIQGHAVVDEGSIVRHHNELNMQCR